MLPSTRPKLGSIVLGLALAGVGIAGAASLNVHGDLHIVAFSGAAPDGDLIVMNQLSSMGSIRSANSIRSDNGDLVTMTGDVEVAAGQIKAVKNYGITTKHIVKTQATNPFPLGAWDLCFLGTVAMTGMGSGKDDSGECTVTGPQSALYAYDQRSNWSIVVGSGSKNVKEVSCTTICMNFSPAKPAS